SNVLIFLSYTMTNYLTCIESIFEERQCNYWVVYGNPSHSEVIYRQPNRSRSKQYFTSGSLFVFDMWETNKFGSTAWRVIIGRALAVGESGFIVKNITPAVNILLDVTGVERCKAVLNWLKLLSIDNDILALQDAKFENANLRFNALSLKEIKSINNNNKQAND
ncbi:MAG: DUF2840 domain-containing protein, partial [Pseudomonadota bacterium]